MGNRRCKFSAELQDWKIGGTAVGLRSRLNAKHRGWEDVCSAIYARADWLGVRFFHRTAGLEEYVSGGDEDATCDGGGGEHFVGIGNAAGGG